MEKFKSDESRHEEMAKNSAIVKAAIAAALLWPIVLAIVFVVNH